MTNILDLQQKRKVNQALAPLLKGRAVALRVVDTKPKKKRIGTPVLFIMPGLTVGMDRRHLLFALPGHGSEVLPIGDIQPLRLMGMGLSAQASRKLRDEINTLYGEHYGSKSK